MKNKNNILKTKAYQKFIRKTWETIDDLIEHKYEDINEIWGILEYTVKEFEEELKDEIDV